VKLLSRISLASSERSDSLEFVVTRDLSLLEICAEVALEVFFLWMAWYTKNYWLVIAFIFGAVAITADWRQGRVTRLIVSETSLIAQGNLRNLTRTSFSKPVSEIWSLGFSTGGRHGIPGLYADKNLLLPGLSRAQVDDIINAIRERFSNFRHIADQGSSVAFISLNLGE
jgi:hypothetical protein